MVFNSRTIFNRHALRVVALGMFAFPEPIISDALGLVFLAASFMLPESWNSKRANACSCGCDFHRYRNFRPKESHLGQGVLLNEPALSIRLSPREAFATNKYGFVPVSMEARPVRTQPDATNSDGWRYSWQSLPRLEGTLLQRLSGYGASTAVKCVYSTARV